MIDWFNIIARRKLPAGDDWQWRDSESVVGGFLLTGSISKEKNGKTVWSKPLQKVFISKDDIEAEHKKYTDTTGKCWNCEGTGQEVHGWSKERGIYCRPCRKCQSSEQKADTP
jgi:hypothetical protein